MRPAAELREQCAAKLLSARERVGQLRAFVGFDGFVDEIVHVVDQRHSADSFQRLPTIKRFSERIASAAGQSTNIELVGQRTKLGGNGPILAHALATLGVKVTYVGALGYPTMHPVFHELAARAEVHSIAEAGHTDALEFDDGKLMLAKTVSMNDVTWPNIQARFGRDRFIEQFSTADLVCFVNWTEVPGMSEIWAALLDEVCPGLPARRRPIFFDLADPEKRSPPDILRALELLACFEKYFEVILGLNEKETYEIGQVLGLHTRTRTPDGLSTLAGEIQERLRLNQLLVHPVACALAFGQGTRSLVEGPLVAQPAITTGAGDHFNAGFCLGKLLGLDEAGCLLTGVTASGFYVRTGRSPAIEDLADLLRHWPDE